MKISGYNPIQDIQPQRGGGSAIPPKGKEEALLSDSVSISSEALRPSQDEANLNRGGGSAIPPKGKED